LPKIKFIIMTPMNNAVIFGFFMEVSLDD